MVSMTASQSKHDRRFMVFNLTDGVPAAPDLMTLQAAQEFVWRFPRRYALQGYYLTASRERVPADRVELGIIDVGTEPPYAWGSNNGGDRT